MTSSTFIFVVLSFLAVSTQIFTSPFFLEEGVSPYCKKSMLYPNWYVPTPIECCDSRGNCPQFIRPNETKYGLTNTDPMWLRRSCSCDIALYNCVTKNLSSTLWNTMRRDYGFGQETCFRQKPYWINRSISNFEFVTVTEAVSWYTRKEYWFQRNRLISPWARK